MESVGFLRELAFDLFTGFAACTDRAKGFALAGGTFVRDIEGPVSTCAGGASARFCTRLNIRCMLESAYMRLRACFPCTDSALSLRLSDGVVVDSKEVASVSKTLRGILLVLLGKGGEEGRQLHGGGVR